eukprot:m.385370 g.385370  ORF g.385370 m.385370 type:complete len:71 (+) comp137283_c0_seq1:30-242(+)
MFVFTEHACAVCLWSLSYCHHHVIKLLSCFSHQPLFVDIMPSTITSIVFLRVSFLATSKAEPHKFMFCIC